ncbi:hypothetical protein TcCL_Unassigned01552, partial [Trypanosoma cruzi]
IDPGRGTHTKDVVTAIPEMNLLLQGPWRPSVLLFCWNEARTKETACRPAVNSCAHHWCHAAAAFRGVCTVAVYRFAWSARLRCGGDRCPWRVVVVDVPHCRPTRGGPAVDKE